ncbi:MAG: hypothetical protein IJV47_00045 [Candidatus Methanomethylophilaceae archaeon]|nr:hypothetical protein [Candidatus Methanomethylophilaceae archaeon]MBQ9688987.1 hypothetical protein [Candidatus Methanomethylophilaceae archaeon]
MRMNYKRQWIGNYLRYHDGASEKKVVRACGLSSAVQTNRDLQKMQARGAVTKDNNGLHLADMD